MNTSRRDFLNKAILTSVACAASPLAFAQQHISLAKILVGFPTGGAVDPMARWIAEKLSGTYADSAIVENKPGASGRLAIESMKRVPTDGSVMIFSPSSMLAMFPHIFAKLSYDPLTDLIPVSLVSEFSHGLAIGPLVPASVTTLSAFISWCKANPTQASIANPGEGSLPQFLTILLSQSSGVPLQPVAYRGTGVAITDVLGGQIAGMMVAAEATYLTYAKEGKIRILATSGPERARFFSEIPTFSELGYKNIVATEWFGMFLPRSAPDPVVTRASAAIRAALAQPDMRERFANFGMVASSSSPEELRAKLRRDYDTWGSVIKTLGFTPMT